VCVGPTDTGRPTIVFEAGLGGDFRTWGEVLGALKTTERGCSYDRAGLGSSDPVATPLTTADQVADLHALLGAAGISPPYVLVGFSSGGWNAMVYADKYPEEVAGLVFVDVRPPDLSVRLLAELPPEVAGESEAIHQSRAEFTTFNHDPSLNPEGLDLAASATQAAAAAPFGDRPVEFLWAGDTSVFWEGLDADLAARMNAVLLELRAGLDARGSRTHSTLVDAPHEIPAEQPGTVVDAVRAVLDALD
jgi:pimeloyl-ACP methyl ester carboxylesterase